MTHRRLLLLKWLMVFIPPVTVVVGHSVLTITLARNHGVPGDTWAGSRRRCW